MNIGRGLICLVAVAVLGGVSGFPEQQLLKENQIEENDMVSKLQGDLLERKGEDSRTKIVCQIAGGKCQPKEDSCDGELREGSMYCHYHNKENYGCCIPPGCVFNGKSYPNNALIEESTCMMLKCEQGDWKYTGKISSHCGTCQVYGDPHIHTYKPHAIEGDIIYLYGDMGTGINIISQSGLRLPAEFELKSTFEECFTNGASCIRSINYTEPGIEVEMILPSIAVIAYCNNLHDPDSDPICRIKTLVNKMEIPIGKSVNVLYGTTGTVLVFNHNHVAGIQDTICMNIVGSKGLSMSLCQNKKQYSFLYVWAWKSLKGQLYGLCDTYTDATPDCYTYRNGTCNGNIPAFADSWKIGEVPITNLEEHLLIGEVPITNLEEHLLIGEVPITNLEEHLLNKCLKHPLVLAEITATCTEKYLVKCFGISKAECLALIGACVFDLCRAPDVDAYAQGYANHLLIDSQISAVDSDKNCAKYGCSCDYHLVPAGCKIVNPATANCACKCIYDFFSCSGESVACVFPGSSPCKQPSTNRESCLNGGGSCAGY